DAAPVREDAAGQAGRGRGALLVKWPSRAFEAGAGQGAAPAAPAQVREGRSARPVVRLPRPERKDVVARAEPLDLPADGGRGGRGNLAPPSQEARLFELVPRRDQGRRARRGGVADREGAAKGKPRPDPRGGGAPLLDVGMSSLGL